MGRSGARSLFITCPYVLSIFLTKGSSKELRAARARATRLRLGVGCTAGRLHGMWWLTLAAGAAASSPAQRASQCTVPACEDQQDTHNGFLPPSVRGNFSPRAARRHLAVSAQCAYRADPRRTSGTVEQLRTYQRDGSWCRLQRQRAGSKNRQMLGDWVAHGGERYFLPYKWDMPNTAYYLAPAAFSQCTGACTAEARTLVRVWGCVVARCWRANHSPYPFNATDGELWPAGTWPTHV
jgi:hypothetical protein